MTDRREDRGQRYDAAMRQVIEGEPGAALRLLGVPAGPAEVVPASFPSSTHAVDLLLRTGPLQLVQVEYQHVGEPGFVDRMLVYRGLIQKAYPGHRLSQHVIVLKDRPITGHDDFDRNGFALDLHVLYLRDLDPEFLLADPALALLAVLGRGTRRQRLDVYARTMRAVTATGGPRLRERLELATILATIRLDRPTMEQRLKEEGMAESIGMEILRSVAEDWVREDERTGMLAELLRARFGDDPGIGETARRLAERPKAEALQSVMAATSLHDLHDLSDLPHPTAKG